MVHFRTSTTAPAVGLSRVPPKKRQTRYVAYGTMCSLLVLVARAKSNPTLWNHIFKLEQQCRGPQKARKLLSLGHTIVEHLRVHCRVVRSWIDGVAGFLAELRDVVHTRKIQRSKCFRVVDLFQESAFFFLRAMQDRCTMAS